jgi:mycothiol synthase
MSDSARSVPDWLASLAQRARATDGAPPFSDQAIVDYRTKARDLVRIEHIAAALTNGAEAEFVVDPDERGHGHGTALLEILLSAGETGMLFWAHGDHPAARALAASHGLTAVRELLHLSRKLTGHQFDTPDRKLTTFSAGTDEDEWVALNALIFAAHAEQGAVTRADLEQLESEPWFAEADFLLLRDADGHMIGYCWLKVEGDRGEFYVVGVHPDHQGERLGSLLFDAGLAHLAARGIHTAHLYVEGDNTPALRLYGSRGFERDSIDIQYSRSPGA